MRKPNKNLSPEELEQLRFAYCTGNRSLNDLAAQFDICYTTLKKKIVKLGWIRESGLRGQRLKSDGLVIQGHNVIYVGPLTEEERLKLGQIIESHAKEVLIRHNDACSKVMILAEQALNKLLVNNGMVERTMTVGKGEEAKEVKVQVPGTDELHALATILAKVIPLERLTYGLDNEPAFGKNGGEAALRRKENEDKAVTIIEETFTRQLKMITSKVVLHGSAAPVVSAEPAGHS